MRMGPIQVPYLYRKLWKTTADLSTSAALRPSLKDDTSGISGRSEPHDVIAAIDVERLTGDGAGQIAGQEQGGAAHLELIYVAVQGSALHVGPHHFAQVADAARRQGLDGPRGDGVHADVLRPQAMGEVTGVTFKSCLGKRHDVVVGHDLLGGVVGQR